MDPYIVAGLTHDERLEYGDEHRWLPIWDRRGWHRLLDGVWWATCRRRGWLCVRGMARRGLVWLMAHTMWDRGYGDSPRHVACRLTALHLPGDILWAGIARIDIRRVPLAAMPDVVAALDQLAEARWRRW